jgi:hypothetical protein
MGAAADAAKDLSRVARVLVDVGRRLLAKRKPKAGEKELGT